jgi:CTP synthase
MPESTNIIVITGGIVSGIGKGISSASIGRLLIDKGYKVWPVKIDPYLNQDAGTMNPLQHGEVFVTNDGTETDLDLGHYERFLDLDLDNTSNFTSGSVYRSVMNLERDGEYLGKTIQIIPHITDEIKGRLDKAVQKNNPDFLLVELGGTIGDIEALPFVEAIRQYKNAHSKEMCFVHVVKMDYLYPSDEGKTKPIQHSVTALRSYGIQPDILIVRCKRALSNDEREKISLFTGVPISQVIAALDATSLYDIPYNLAKQGLVEAISNIFNLDPGPTESAWDQMRQNISERKGHLPIALVGKYLTQDDAYLSVMEAIRHAGIYNQVFIDIIPINAEAPNLEEKLSEVKGIIVPGGFGIRGIEGKIRAIAYARSHKIPYLGLCLGLQTAVIEYARNQAGLKKATSREFEENSTQAVIDILPEQIGVTKKGGTMRLGAYPAVLQKGSLAERLYRQFRPLEIDQQNTILERHRHRYEVNPAYHQLLKDKGLIFSGISPDGTLVEFIELPNKVHPYFIATQAHPEFRSRPNRPHPLFAGLIETALKV